MRTRMPVVPAEPSSTSPYSSSAADSPTNSAPATNASAEPAVDDTKALFLRVPWIARRISGADVECRVPDSREAKSDLEDSLLAETLRTGRTLRSCICAHARPRPPTAAASSSPSPDAGSGRIVDEVSTFVALGDGLNGYPAILHGGITATLIDEATGIFLTTNFLLAHLARVARGEATGPLPPHSLDALTAELKVRYFRPVRAPGFVAVVVRLVKKEGRKEWLRAEVLQSSDGGEKDAEPVVCATGDVLYVQPRAKL